MIKPGIFLLSLLIFIVFAASSFAQNPGDAADLENLPKVGFIPFGNTTAVSQNMANGIMLKLAIPCSKSRYPAFRKVLL